MTVDTKYSTIKLVKEKGRVIHSIMDTMHLLQTPHSFFSTFSFPKTLNPNPRCPPHLSFRLKAFGSDEFPVDETFLQNFGPKDKETEDEARRRNWIERGWAPWEEILTPEANFARKSLNEGEEVALQSPEAIEAFKMLRPSYRKQKMEEMGLTEDDYYKKQFEIKGNIPAPLETTWGAPLVVRHVAPRDWPPRDWEVDREELEFIRGAHKTMATRVKKSDLENKEGKVGNDELCLDRYKVFLKQYKEWAAVNKDRLEEESYKVCLSKPTLC